MTRQPASSAAAPGPAAAADRRVALFALTSGWSAALLFMVQPFAARLLLPLLGGSPAVWNTAMVFFQTALLVGYACAHGATAASPRARRLTILALLVAGVISLPLWLPDGWTPPSGTGQAAWVLGALAVTVGVPFVALSSLSPTLQRWFSETDHPRAGSPYFLYAAGNVGSAVGLLAYPLVVEPTLTLHEQSRVWSAGYVVLLVLVAACALVSRPTSDSAADAADAPRADERVTRPPVRWSDRLAWVGIAAVPSGLLLAVTRHLSTDVAAVPLLWVVPLFLYLATFVAAFRGDQKAPGQRGLRMARLAAIPLVGLLVGNVAGVLGFAFALAVHLAAFALLAWGCHSLLASRRPDAGRLTEFYLWVSVGGALGGTLVAIAAPVVFDRVTEYPLFVAAAVLVCGFGALPRGEVEHLDSGPARRSITVAGGATAAALAAAVVFAGDASATALLAGAFVAAGAAMFVAEVRPRHFAVGLAVLAMASVALDTKPHLHESRTFFGVYRVSQDDGTHVFEHGTTIHGEQQFEPRVSSEPTAYYTREGPVGRAIAALQQDRPRHRVTVVGLGAGTIAAYGRPGDRYRFIEIDQRVVDIARDPRLFRFLDDSEAQVTTTVGDGRLVVEASRAHNDLIVLDAFSSDAIPVHLLTREALRIDADRLAPGGVIAVHISNRYFDLAPVLAGTAATVGLDAHVLEADGSRWVALVRPGEATGALARELDRWQHLPADDRTPVWTDDHSNVLGALDL